MSLKPRTPDELKLMRKSGEITAKALKKVLEAVHEDVTLNELDDIAEAEIRRLGGEPGFQKVPGYKWTTCLTINEEVVHGIPRDIKLKKGDKLSIDIGAWYQGWNTDAAWSVIVGSREVGVESKESKDEQLPHQLFLMVGEKALWKAIDQAVDGNRVGDISNAIQETIEGAGCSVVRTLVGHGVGKELHEDPQIPGLGHPGTGPLLKAGMTIAIEAIYTAGMPEVVTDKDKWTIKSKDGSLGGLFEMSLIVGEKEPEVLTDWRKY
jgi:methionyl aminopeptidase